MLVDSCHEVVTSRSVELARHAVGYIIVSMYYVYILQSKVDRSYYIGATQDLKRRLKEHNSGNSKFTSTKMPYILKWYCCFNDKRKAFKYETYLKSSSGYAYWKKRFI